MYRKNADVITRLNCLYLGNRDFQSHAATPIRSLPRSMLKKKFSLFGGPLIFFLCRIVRGSRLTYSEIRSPLTVPKRITIIVVMPTAISVYQAPDFLLQLWSLIKSWY